MVPLSRVATCLFLLLLVCSGAAQEGVEDASELRASPAFSILLEGGGEINIAPMELRLSGSWTTPSGWNIQFAPGLSVRQDGWNRSPWGLTIRARVAPAWAHSKKTSLGLTFGYRYTTFRRFYRYCIQEWHRGGFLKLRWDCRCPPDEPLFRYSEAMRQFQAALSLELWSKSERICADFHVGTQYIQVVQGGLPEGGFPGYVHPKWRYKTRREGSYLQPYFYLGIKYRLFTPEVGRLVPSSG